MSTSLLYHTFGVRGYEYRSTAYGGGGMTMTIEQPRQALCCSQCGGKKVHAKGGVVREFRSLPIGEKPVRLRMRAVDEQRASCVVSDVLCGVTGVGRVCRSEEIVHAAVRSVCH